MATVENVAAVLRDATDARRVAIRRLVDGMWTPVAAVEVAGRADDHTDEVMTNPQGFLHDMVDVQLENDAPTGPHASLPEPGTSTDHVSVPLARDGTYGRLELTWSGPRPLDEASRALIGTAAALTALVLHDLRLTKVTERRSRLQQAVTNGAGILVSHADDEGVLTKLVDAYTDLVGARLCAIALVDARNTTITALATRGTSPLEGPIPLHDIPHGLLGPVERQWAEEPAAIDLGDHLWLRDVAGGGEAGASWYRLVPLMLGYDACGAVVLGFAAERRLDPEESLAIDALTGIASAVLERSFQTRRREHQLRRLDALHRLNSALAQGGDAPALVNHINELLAEDEVEVISLAFADRRLARRLHGDAFTKAEQGPRFRQGVSTESDDGRSSIPMRAGGRLVGAMRIRMCSPDAAARAFVADVAADLAEAVVRDEVRAAVGEADRQQALVNEQRRIAHDLHDSAGQLFSAIRLLAEDRVESLAPGSVTRDRVIRMAELAAQGKREIDHAIRGLALVPSGSDGIADALKKLAREVANDSGLEIEVHVRGSRVRLDAETERVLFRVAHEALANAWRHARCDHVDVGLSFTADAVVLRIADDGVGPHGDEPQSGSHLAALREGTGIAGMRRAVEGLGGHLAIRHHQPRGTVVDAHVPGGGP